MNVIHLSAECYPVAKVGGLGDVVGALPKYQQAAGVSAIVVLPYYDRKFVKENDFEVIFESNIVMGPFIGPFQVLRETTNKLGFPLHLIKIPGLLDRPEIYCYPDESEQFLAYQIAFLEWLKNFEVLPDVIHSHDHHAGLIPFLIYHSSRYKSLSQIATVLTIHNGQYQGWIGWEKLNLLPDIDVWEGKLLEWGDCINPLASAVKCCWKYTTVSPSYLEELSTNSNGLEKLFIAEAAKGVGIINGIDTDIWNPETDPMISANYTIETATEGKAANKKLICQEFFLEDDKPLVAFIGRLVGEKGADLLPEAITKLLLKYKNKVNILILGSGEKEIEEGLANLTSTFKENYNVFIGYHEALSHRIYAGADFLIMPSRVEPCGLNQLYSLRYGTVPIVRSTGGLKDTVVDITEENGYGIRFEEADVDSIVAAVSRAVEIYKNTTQMQLLRSRMMSLNYSWHQSAAQYINLYNNLKSL
ncbi:MAG: glycogen synthase [Sphingobacteriaceae bacterium]|nr:glycogen synthase [Sphingobacteriaceae bacterium]